MVRHNLRTKINAYTGLFFAALFILVENCKQLQAPRWELTAYSNSETSVPMHSMVLQQGKSVNTNLGHGQGILLGQFAVSQQEGALDILDENLWENLFQLGSYFY